MGPQKRRRPAWLLRKLRPRQLQQKLQELKRSDWQLRRKLPGSRLRRKLLESRRKDWQQKLKQLGLLQKRRLPARLPRPPESRQRPRLQRKLEWLLSRKLPEWLLRKRLQGWKQRE